MSDSDARRPIGLFDSGVGGLSVLRHVRVQIPHEALLYVADQAHVPYGARPAGEIRAYSFEITRFLLTQGARLIVIPCNTATGAALTYLRESFPDVPFVGMEPAVKPGAQLTRSGRVGVLATAGTFASQRYADLMHRFASDVTVLENPCTGLVEQIEAGEVASDKTKAILDRCVTPMLAAGVDTLILGCTHYPFVLPLLRSLVGPDVAIIDPAPAVARQVKRRLAEHGLTGNPGATGSVQMCTTGAVGRFAKTVGQLLGESYPVMELGWVRGQLQFGSAPAGTGRDAATAYPSTPHPV